jgi:hypothetical protein
VSALFLVSTGLSGGFSEAATPTPQRPVLTDLAGHEAKPLPDHAARFVVFVFARTDCPISNSYAPEIVRLHAEFASRGVTFWLVYPDAEVTADAIQQHIREYRYPCAALRDPHQLFARQSHVRVTPEVALYRADGELLYHGRIDDRYVDFGECRAHADQRDLQEALQLALAGKPIPQPHPPGVGCFIEGTE